MVLYIHGFASSGKSSKALRLKELFGARGIELSAPDLPVRPLDAIRLIEGIIDGNDVEMTIGSSLGGFYSYYIANYHRIPGIQINPLTTPVLMKGYVGIHENYYNGSVFEWTEGHIIELEEILCRIEERLPSYLNLFLSLDDEVINIEEAKEWYKNANSFNTFTGKGHQFMPVDDAFPLIEGIYNGYKNNTDFESYFPLNGIIENISKDGL